MCVCDRCNLCVCVCGRYEAEQEWDKVDLDASGLINLSTLIALIRDISDNPHNPDNPLMNIYMYSHDNPDNPGCDTQACWTSRSGVISGATSATAIACLTRRDASWSCWYTQPA